MLFLVPVYYRQFGEMLPAYLALRTPLTGCTAFS